MGSRRYDPLKTLGLQRVKIAGSFGVDGTPAITDVRGKGFTVSRTGAGEYLVTFDDKYVELMDVSVSTQNEGVTPKFTNAGDYDDTGATPTLQMRHFVEAAGTFAVAELANDPNSRIHFSATFRNTSVDF